jgi:hypothetical protein
MSSQEIITSELVVIPATETNYQKNGNHYSKEMMKKLQTLLPYSPSELVNSINDYWGSTRQKTEEAQAIYSIRSTNTQI